MEKATVLIVDDTPQNRRTLHDLILEMGHTPIEAEDFARAKWLLDEQPPDLVLLDLELGHAGGKSGLDLLKFIRDHKEDFPFLPVIIVSVSNEKLKIVTCLRAGADDYIINPFAGEELRARLHNALQRYQLMKELRDERQRTERVLSSILPEKIAQLVISNGKLEPRRHKRVAVLFSDLDGFTADSQSKTPREVFEGLHNLFREFESQARYHRVEKIKTVGDAFMATAGLLEEVDDPVARCVRFGKAAIAKARELRWSARVGVHVGPVIAGFVGDERYVYDLLGHTVNMAARVESIARPNSICVSSDAYQAIREEYPNVPAEPVDLKNVTSPQLVHHIWTLR